MQPTVQETLMNDREEHEDGETRYQSVGQAEWHRMR
jgi:hypothetical protein